MSTQYIASCTLDVNGQAVDDFKEVREQPFELWKRVKAQRKTGFARVHNPEFGVEVDYLCPANASEFDWEAVADGTLTIERENGVRIVYTGVYVMTIGDQKIDGENETVRTITLGATGRAKE